MISPAAMRDHALAEAGKARPHCQLHGLWGDPVLALVIFVGKQPQFFDLASLSQDLGDTKKDALVLQKKGTCPP